MHVERYQCVYGMSFDKESTLKISRGHNTFIKLPVIHVIILSLYRHDVNGNVFFRITLMTVCNLRKK